MQRKYNRLKNLEIKITKRREEVKMKKGRRKKNRKKKKENSTELQKLNVESEAYNNNKKM